MGIVLSLIDKSNWRECVNLQVTEAQRGFVATNSVSLLEATYEENLYPLAIYNDETMVGFVMYDFDQEIGLWGMCRLMVDQRFQRQGYGRKAIVKLLKEVKKKHGPIEFYTLVEPGNQVALQLYEDLGFVNSGRIVYDEILLTILL